MRCWRSPASARPRGCAPSGRAGTAARPRGAGRPDGPRMRVADLLFDLDGTLVDSAPVILESFRRAITATGAPLVTPLDRSVIGAPLGPTLLRLTRLQDENPLPSLPPPLPPTHHLHKI